MSLLTVVLLTTALAQAQQPMPQSTPQSIPTTLATATPAPVATAPLGPPSPTPTLSPAIDRASLRKEFVQAQKGELAALKHRNSMDLKMLDSAQSAAFKEWWAKEQQKRRKYFADHSEGKDKRAYVQDLNARRKTFLQIQKDERTRRLQEQKSGLDAAQDTQTKNLKGFDDSLKVGQVPPAKLWPTSH